MGLWMVALFVEFVFLLSFQVSVNIAGGVHNDVSQDAQCLACRIKLKKLGPPTLPEPVGQHRLLTTTKATHVIPAQFQLLPTFVKLHIAHPNDDEPDRRIVLPTHP